MKYIITERQLNLINEQLDMSSPYIRRRLLAIETLIEEEVAELLKDDNNTIEFMDRFDFMDVVVNGVVDQFLDNEENEEIDEDDLREFIKDEYGDYLLSMYPNSDENEDDEFDDEDDELEDEDDEDEF
jgi:hypothetical protein